MPQEDPLLTPPRPGGPGRPPGQRPQPAPRAPAGVPPAAAGGAPTRILAHPGPDGASITVLVDDHDIPGEFHVRSATIRRHLNQVPSASIQLSDGDAAPQPFAASNAGHFLPGRRITIQLGHPGETETVFTGIVVKHGIHVRNNDAHLELQVFDRAVAMTTTTHCHQFTDLADSDILNHLFGQYGLARRVTPTATVLPQVVSYDTTDWDFAICRAEANGHVVAVRDGRVTVAPPDTKAKPVVATRLGATLLELDAEIDARHQPTGVTAWAWSAAHQRLLKAQASEPTATASGNLAASDLTDVASSAALGLRHGGGLAQPELQAWADARLLAGRLAQVRGRARFQGFATVEPDEVVELTGIGDRFSGRQYVTGVRHTFADGNWHTDVTFGLDPEPYARRHPVTAVPAGGLLAAVNGLQPGVVTALGPDPTGEERIRVDLPMLAHSDGLWARLATLDAGEGRGTYFRPEIGDEVVVGFLDADPRFPVVLGQLHSSAKPAPEHGADENHLKGYVSRSGIRLGFDDEAVAVVLETPAGNTLTLSEADGTALVANQHGNKVTMDSSGITLDSTGDLLLKAAGAVQLQGDQVELAAQASLKLAAHGPVAINAGGALDIKGSLVQINGKLT